MSTRISRIVYQWLISAHYCLLPGICLVCRQSTDGPRDLCKTCADSLTSVPVPCPRCALPLPALGLTASECGACLHRPPAFRYCCAPWQYSPPISQLVSAFKSRGKLHVAKILAPVLAHRLRQFYRDKPWPELLIPIPLHRSRLRQRGYNQALLLARALGNTLELPVAASVCRRRRNTPDQKGLNARDRKRNLRKAFAIDRPDALQGLQRVAIVDDVVTTMSTAGELARTLRRAGVKEVHLWALARTLQG